MTAILNSSEYVTINHGSSGDILPWDKSNERPVACRYCGTGIPEGQGFPFQAARFSGLSSGYICDACLQATLRGHTWHFNSFSGELFPANPLTVYPVQGDALVDGWNADGQMGIRMAAANAKALWLQKASEA